MVEQLISEWDVCRARADDLLARQATMLRGAALEAEADIAAVFEQMADLEARIVALPGAPLGKLRIALRGAQGRNAQNPEWRLIESAVRDLEAQASLRAA